MADRKNEQGAPMFRCGWRIKRHVGDSWPYPVPAVVIQRGEWRVIMPAQDFDYMADEEFTSTISQLYRDGAFEQLQQDLDILAGHMLAHLEYDGAPQTSGPSPGDVKAALYRWQKTKRDTQEATT